MIFDESAVCTPVFCREVTGETPVLLPAAPFTVVLASSGRAAASADSEPVLLAAGGLFLAGGVAVEVTPVTGCHVLAAGFSGTAAQAAAAGLPAPLASDCSACPMAAQLLGELAAAMERGGASGGPPPGPPWGGARGPPPCPGAPRPGFPRCATIFCANLPPPTRPFPGFRRWWRMRCWPSARIMQACTAWRS